MSDKFDNLKPKIKYIRSHLQDKTTNIFGTKEHKFNLKPTLTEEEITRFEELHNITLPPQYRKFISEIGNGGMGPGYGLIPLNSGRLSVPFSYTETWLYNSDNVDLDNETDEEFESRLDGSMLIADYGCSLLCYLVITGEEAGNIWQDARGTTYEIAPYTDTNGKHLDFVTWYDLWLDEIMNKHLR